MKNLLLLLLLLLVHVLVGCGFTNKPRIPNVVTSINGPLQTTIVTYPPEKGLIDQIIESAVSTATDTATRLWLHAQGLF
jgi:outer membrane lipopolysaccharide assembly protein LptE/RlpB